MSPSKTRFVTLDDATEYADNQHSRLGIEVITKDYVERGALGETDFFFGELKGRQPIYFEPGSRYWTEIKRKAIEELLEEQWRYLTKGMRRTSIVNNTSVPYLKKLNLKQKAIVVWAICKLKWKLFKLPKTKKE